mmetsp:Transcript_45742/g.120915  ORF Transcript_45742/g.120915 Transcript_45742/m.120915 type:complete len:220 (-) Transcript_45742:188-847(-)
MHLTMIGTCHCLCRINSGRRALFCVCHNLRLPKANDTIRRSFHNPSTSDGHGTVSRKCAVASQQDYLGITNVFASFNPGFFIQGENLDGSQIGIAHDQGGTIRGTTDDPWIKTLGQPIAHFFPLGCFKLERPHLSCRIENCQAASISGKRGNYIVAIVRCSVLSAQQIDSVSNMVSFDVHIGNGRRSATRNGESVAVAGKRQVTPEVSIVAFISINCAY